jgi:hypothetical protein
MKCFIQLGKHGDLIILLPGLKRHFERTGERAVVMVSNEFASTLEGVTYAYRWKVNYHWFQECNLARKTAEKQFGKGNVIFPKWWDDPSVTPEGIRGSAERLIAHAQKMGIERSGEEMAFRFSYMSSMWKRAGFPESEFMERPVFDRRDKNAEQAVIEQNTSQKKPVILHCLNKSGSSPFPYEQQVMELLWPLQKKYDLVDLTQVRAPRIFDLLGLMEKSELLITSDTSIMHLAGACPKPYIALTNNLGAGSVPRGNCVLNVKYGRVTNSINEISETIKNHAS